MGERLGILVSVTVLSAAVFLSAPVLKADVTGSILGTVTDPSSAVLPNVEVTATNVKTNLHQAVKTDVLGEYRILALPVGTYRVEATVSGFQQFVESGIVLTVDEQRRVDIVLRVGTIEQKVEVNAQALQVEASSSQLGQVIEEQHLLALPLNGRSFIDLLGLQPGVVPTSSGAISQNRPVSGELAAGNFSVNGNRESGNSFMVNGGDVNESMNMGVAVIPNLDSVAEFRLVSNSFDPEYGRFAGAIMNAITKSGTNGLHGTAFEFLRNDDMDSRNFFSPTRGAFKRNQFGYAVGGPLIRNKLFWFTDYQGTREVLGIATGNVQLPTVAQRSGDFSALPNAFLTGSGQRATVNGSYWAQVLSNRLGYGVNNGEPYGFAGCNNTSDCVFPGNTIPQRAFAPTTLPMEQFIPLPNTGANILSTSGNNKTTRDDKAAQRIDFTNKLTGNWFFYYLYDDSTVTNPYAFYNTPGFPGLIPSRAEQGVMSNIHVFGPSVLNEFRFSVMRASTTNSKWTSGLNTKLADLGFIVNQGLGIFPDPKYQGPPTMGFVNFSVGNGSQEFTPQTTWQVLDGVSKVYGRHNLKFGGEFRYLQVNDRQNHYLDGDFNFDGSETGNDIADFLLGAPSRDLQESPLVLDSRSKYGAVYAQDSFRLKSNLTLNFGLRWEVSTPWYDTQNRIETLIPGEQSTVFPTSPLGWLFPGDPNVPNTLAPIDYKEFDPRIGLAYSPNIATGFLGKLFGGPGRTSIRAAYGMYFTAIEDVSMFDEKGDAPFGNPWITSAPDLMQEPFRARADGSSEGKHFPFVLPTPGDKTLDFSTFEPISGSPGYWYQNRQPYTEHYNFTVQRSLGSAMVMSLAYVATQGHRLLAETESNPGNAALCLSLRGSGVLAGTPQCGANGENTIYTLPNGSQVNGTRGPFGNNFGSNAFQKNTAASTYNSFQASLQRKAANMTFLASYTYGKVLTNSSGYNSTWLNFSNYALSRSLALFDMTHNFVFSYAYELPFGHFRSLPSRLTRGWSLNGITRFTTGFPVLLSESGDRSLVGSTGIDFPNLVGPVSFLNPRQFGPAGNNQYFSTTSFTAEALGSIGNANRAFFHGPGLNNWDFSLHKDTAIRENMHVQFRAEFFNIFNHAQFSNPGGNFASGTFGRVTSARDPRIGQMSLKFLF